MTTINLQQDQREELINNTGKLNFGLVVFAIVFSIILLSYIGLKVGSNFFNQKNAKLREQILSTGASLNGSKSVDDVIDLQFRVKQIKDNLDSRVEVTGTLDKVAKAVIPGVVFSSYSDVDKKIEINFRANDFNNVSKQIFSFKQADFVSSVGVKGLVRDEKGIKCDIEINVK